jgi:hypothetical protein
VFVWTLVFRELHEGGWPGSPTSRTRHGLDLPGSDARGGS